METIAQGLFFVLGVVFPGIALQRALGVRCDPTLVLPIGGATTALLYWLSGLTDQAWLFPIAVVALSAAWLRGVPGDPGPEAPGRDAVYPVAAIVVVLAATVYPLHRLDAQGDFLLDGETALAADTAFHVGVTRELTMGYPPQVPGLAGFPLRYHLGTDLVRAAASRWARLDPYDAINRVDVTIWAVALLLAIRGGARLAGASPLAVGLAGFSLLAGDFSFAFAANPQAHWWTDLLRGNVLLSLLYANPVIPALAMALGSLIALARHRHEERSGWLVIALGLALTVAGFKVFLGAHLALGLLVAGLLRRDTRALACSLAAATSTAWLTFGGGDHGVAVSVSPFDLVNVTRETLALPPRHGLALAGWALLWLLASVGLRWLGVGEAVRALEAPSPVCALAVMALAGWPLGLLFKVAPPDAVAGQRPINDASFLVEQSGPLLWIFAALTLARLAERHGRALVLALAAMLALPATVHFVVKKAGQAPHPLPASTVRAMAKLATHTQPGEVVLQRPGRLFPPAPVILIGRRVAYERFTPYLTQFAPREDLERRHADVHRFFEGADAAEARAIATRLGARFLVLYARDPRPRFDLGALYEKVYGEPGVDVYRRKD